MGRRIQADVRNVYKPELDLERRAISEYQRVAANHNDALRIIEAAVAIDVRYLLSKITAPTLVIHHRDDRVVPIDSGQELAAGIKGARFLSFPGAHIASQEDFSLAFSAIVEVRRRGRRG